MTQRVDVLWCGAPPTEEDLEALSLFQLRVQPLMPGDTPQFERACALVINGYAPHVEDAELSLDRVGPALDCGCLVYVLAGDDVTQGRLQARLSQKHDRIRAHTTVGDRVTYARAIARHGAGPPPNHRLSIILGEGVNDLGAEEELLIRRAFSDAIEVRLNMLPAGRSGALVYQADAQLKHSLAGARPMPFFVKLGPNEKIGAERGKYAVYATIHVPFNLRPNLVDERCVDGRSRAVLVGNLVENGEPLAHVARRGDGAPAINCLFSETLRGWRDAAMEDEPESACLADRLGYLVDSLKPQILSHAATFGRVYEPPELRARLRGIGQQRYFAGPVHGDLHGDNVLVVRGPYAILLDFGTVTRGPIITDVGNLDVWLACEPGADNEGIPTFEEWRESVSRLYDTDALVRPPDAGRLPARFGPLEATVRELRSWAVNTSLGEQDFPIAVALHLAGRARYLDSFDADELNRRAYAYFLACQLVDELIGV